MFARATGTHEILSLILEGDVRENNAFMSPRGWRYLQFSYLGISLAPFFFVRPEGALRFLVTITRLQRINTRKMLSRREVEGGGEGWSKQKKTKNKKTGGYPCELMKLSTF